MSSTPEAVKRKPVADPSPMALARKTGLGVTVPKPPTVNPFINQTPPLSGIRVSHRRRVGRSRTGERRLRL